MAITGYFDGIIDGEVIGWAWNSDEPNSRLTVRVLAGGELVGTGCADLYRQDLQSHGIGDGQHAFRIRICRLANEIRCEVGDLELPDSRLLLQEQQRAQQHARFVGCFAHTPYAGLPTPRYGIRDSRIPTHSYQIAKRLIDSYRAAISHQRLKLGNIWKPIVTSLHAELRELLDRGSEKELCSYLFNAPSGGISEGFLEGKHGYNAMLQSEEHRASMTALYFDHLVSLAESLGCISVQCPEQGEWNGNFNYEPDTLVQKIEDEIGIDISPPAGLNGSFGILTSRGFLNFRMIGAIYAAYRLKCIAGVGASVCEIGAGAGLVAYYANRMGIADYTILDLPTVNVLQAFMLHSSLPDTPLTLYGENPAGRGIRIVPPHCLETFAPGEFDIVLAQDNLPEFSREVALGYIHKCKQLRIKFFLSINQEAQAAVGGVKQNWVSELFDEVGGFRRILRMRHWLRAGYVEEVYEHEHA